MKYTVHVNVTLSVEIDAEDLKKEFGKVTKKLILQEAVQKATLDNAFEFEAKIFDKYEDEVKKARKGISSY